MMIKYRVREVAKDLDIPNKDVIDILAKYCPDPKKYMTALTEEERAVMYRALSAVSERLAQMGETKTNEAALRAEERK